MKRINLSLLLAFVCAFVVQARDVSVFNEGWQFKKGPFNPSHAYLETTNLAGNWQKVTLPHTWNNKDMQSAMVGLGMRTPQERFYTGEAYYKKEYTPAADLKGKRVFLRFEGVGTVATVYVNNRFAGSHKGAYSAFAVELSTLLKYGEKNTIVVKVDNTAREDIIPVNNTLFGVYGGIYRDVSLIVTEDVNIAVTDYASSGVYISQKSLSKNVAELEVKVKIDNKTKKKQDVRLRTTIYEMDGKVKTKSETKLDLPVQGRQIELQNITVRKPHLWQGLEDPYLYKVVTQLIRDNQVIDELVQPLGLRTVELKASDGVYLNGKKIPMYGVCRHQDWLDKGSALTKKEHDIDMEIIQEIGATTIRLAHYQQADYIYSKCDSIGLLVWAEIPFVNRVTTKEGENAKQQLTELIRQNYNHPSIYIWGLHNEVYTPYEFTNALTTELHDLAKTEDPYRYTGSVNGHNTVDQASNLNADVQGINHYFGWYGGKISDIGPWIEKVEKEFSDVKLIYSEYGTEANIDQQREEVGEWGDCCGYNNDYNETFATKFHEIQWGYIAKSKTLLASYIWNTFDFATPMSSQGGVQSRNMKGLVTFDRKVKKDGFYWYKANWSKEPVVYLTQRRLIYRGKQVTPVTVYSNRGVPTLKVNGQVLSIQPEQGTTAVHYIFKGVELSEGENTIEVEVNKEGETFSDKVVWNYSPDFDVNSNSNQPKLRTKEHVGL